MKTDAIENTAIEVTEKEVEVLSNIMSFSKKLDSSIKIFLIRNGLGGLNPRMYGFDNYLGLVKHIYDLINILDKFLVAARIGFESEAEFSAKYKGHYIVMKALSLYTTYIQISAIGIDDTPIAQEDKILKLIEEATLLMVENINDLPSAI